MSVVENGAAIKKRRIRAEFPHSKRNIMTISDLIEKFIFTNADYLLTLGKNRSFARRYAPTCGHSNLNFHNNGLFLEFWFKWDILLWFVRGLEIQFVDSSSLMNFQCKMPNGSAKVRLRAHLAIDQAQTVPIYRPGTPERRHRPWLVHVIARFCALLWLFLVITCFWPRSAQPSDAVEYQQCTNTVF